jgi:hypothetical protein
MKVIRCSLVVVVFACLGFDSTCVPANAQATCVAPPSGLVAWYRAEDDALDFTLVHPGLLKGGTAFTLGEVGKAFRFGGADDVIEIPDSPEFNPAKITLEAWVKPDSIKVGSRVVSKELAVGSCLPPYGVWSIDIRSDAGNRAVFHFNIGGTLHNLAGTTEIPTGQFTHLAATYDGSVAQIFVNGIPDGSLAVSGTLASSTAPVLIGNAGTETRTCYPGLVEFDGLIDEVTIYNRALAPAEIQAVVAAGAAGKCPLPRLKIQVTGGNALISWNPATPGFVLEQATSLPPISWQPGPAGNPTAPFPVANSTRFYRLRKP